MPKIDTLKQHVFDGWSYKVETPDGTCFVHVMEDEAGKPIGITINIGKAGTGVSAWTNALSRVCSLALDHGASIPELVNELSGITTDRRRLIKNGIAIRSGIEGVAYALMQYSAQRYDTDVRYFGIIRDTKRLGV